MTHPLLPPPAEERDGAIVLVHGAWVGEWSWLGVLPLLADSGRTIHNVSLTGHGIRTHQGGPHVTLSDHVDDVVAVIENFDLTNVTLVGHSYGGRVITQVAARIPDRFAAFVFLDAHAPIAEDPGQPPERVAEVEANGGMFPFTGYDPDPELLGGDEAVRWFMERTVDQSFACFSEAWQTALPDETPKTYIYATENQPSRFEQYAIAASNDPSWKYVELAGPHFLMHSHPAEVAELILEADPARS